MTIKIFQIQISILLVLMELVPEETQHLIQQIHLDMLNLIDRIQQLKNFPRIMIHPIKYMHILMEIFLMIMKITIQLYICPGVLLNLIQVMFRKLKH